MVSAAFQFLQQKLVGLVGSFLLSLLSLFGIIRAFLFRFKNNGDLVSNKNSIKTEESNYIKPVPEVEVHKDHVAVKESSEEEKQEVFLKFKFPTYEEFIRSKKEDGELSVGSFVKEGELVSSVVSEFIADEKEYSVGQKASMLDGFLSYMDLKQTDAKTEVKNENEKENLDYDLCKAEDFEKPEEVKFTKRGERTSFGFNFRSYEESTSEGLSYSEKDSLFTSSDSETTSLEHVHSVMSRLADSYSDGFLSDGDFEGEFEVVHFMNVPAKEIDLQSEISDLEENWETEEFDAEEDSDIMGELDQLERDDSRNSCSKTSDFLSDKDFQENTSKVEDDHDDKDDNPLNGRDYSEKNNSSEDILVSDSGDSNKLESLWEHQELIEQLQMELKKVRATGLPTILEESESPKIMDDLKPWKIDDKLHHEDYMGELHKIHKSYRERMRKLDILNYQKMYAIGFLQLKDPLQSITSHKPSGPTLKSLLSQNFWLLKNKRHENDPMTKFIKELQSDLEVVYVGQMCLSWEFIHWQYGKALDLWNSDPRGIRQYNEVAGEFQQFQVLMQRFLEDEPIQGPRVQHYIKSRCVLRNLLHVPVIREDGLKDKRKARKRETAEYAITSDTLIEILEESIRIIWRFIRADKDCSSVALKGQRETSVELQNPEDLGLLVELRKTLLKKERKLKELLKGQNCILRRFKKRRDDDDSDQVLYFFSQVDIKLVSRVMNMSRLTTDQLVWCSNKLSKISFVNRKIHVEPSFLLFPC